MAVTCVVDMEILQFNLFSRKRVHSAREEPLMCIWISSAYDTCVSPAVTTRVQDPGRKLSSPSRHITNHRRSFTTVAWPDPHTVGAARRSKHIDKAAFVISHQHR